MKPHLSGLSPSRQHSLHWWQVLCSLAFRLTDTQGANSPRRQGGQVEGTWRFVSVMKKASFSVIFTCSITIGSPITHGWCCENLKNEVDSCFILPGCIIFTKSVTSTTQQSLIAVFLKEHLRPKSWGTADDISPWMLWSSRAARHKALPFSIDISASHIAQNTGLRRKSGAVEVARGNKALQAANVLCCFSYSEQNGGVAWGW